MDFDAKVESFCVKVKRLQIDGPLMSAKRTLELMRELLTTQKHTDPWSLIDHVKAVGTKLICAKPQELAVGNMVRRVLHLIREVAAQTGATAQKEEEDAHRFASTRGVSLLTLLDKPLQSIPEDALREKDFPDGRDDCSVAETADSAELPTSRKQAKRTKQWAGKTQVIEFLNEVIEEIELAEDNIIEKATEHIHASEVILTFGLSRTTLKFLIKASERRSFQVIVAEGAPGHEGLTMARQLIDAGISTMVIPDTSIFALMARVNKVIVGARAVLATGGILAHSGTRLVALAAHHHRVPFVVIAGLYKLSPLFPHDPQVMFNDFKSPAKFTNHSLLSCAMKVSADDVYEESLLKLPCPTLDYTAPELIDLLITDTGGYTPSYIYRLLSEYYTREDYVLSVQLLNRLSGY